MEEKILELEKRIAQLELDLQMVRLNLANHEWSQAYMDLNLDYERI